MSQLGWRRVTAIRSTGEMADSIGNGGCVEDVPGHLFPPPPAQIDRRCRLTVMIVA